MHVIGLLSLFMAFYCALLLIMLTEVAEQPVEGLERRAGAEKCREIPAAAPASPASPGRVTWNVENFYEG